MFSLKVYVFKENVLALLNSKSVGSLAFGLEKYRTEKDI